MWPNFDPLGFRHSWWSFPCPLHRKLRLISQAHLIPKEEASWKLSSHLCLRSANNNTYWLSLIRTKSSHHNSPIWVECLNSGRKCPHQTKYTCTIFRMWTYRLCEQNEGSCKGDWCKNLWVSQNVCQGHDSAQSLHVFLSVVWFCHPHLFEFLLIRSQTVYTTPT